MENRLPTRIDSGTLVYDQFDGQNQSWCCVCRWVCQTFRLDKIKTNGCLSMQVELKMNAKNNAYTIVSLVFFLSYALFQPPATVAIREIGPRLFLSTIVFLWGAVMIVSSC